MNQVFSLDVYTLSCQNIVVRRRRKVLQSTLQSSIKKNVQKMKMYRGYLKKKDKCFWLGGGGARL